MSKRPKFLILGLMLVLIFQGTLMATEIPILTQAELQGIGGYATQFIYCATGTFDNSDAKYKMWFSVYDWSPQRYAWYYKESPTLNGLADATPQQCLYGNYVDVNIPAGLTIRKLGDGSYGMWYSIYYINPPNGGGQKNFIHYRHSADGINWGDQQTVLAPTTSITDDAEPKAVPLANGKTRLYYYHLQSGVQSIRYVDVGSSGTDTSNMHQIYTGGNFLMAGSLIGGPGSDAHHRLWFYTRSGATPIDLISYDSDDEGQTWTLTNKGPYNASMGRIVHCFYSATTEEYFIRVNPAMNAVYLSQPEQYQNFDLYIDRIEVNQCIQTNWDEVHPVANKPTVVRVYADNCLSGSIPASVVLKYRKVGESSWKDANPIQPNRIPYEADSKFIDERMQIVTASNSYNFYFPDGLRGNDGFTQGDYDFIAEVIPGVEGETNPGNNTKTKNVHFSETKGLRLIPYRLQVDGVWPDIDIVQFRTNIEMPMKKVYPEIGRAHV